MNKHNLEILELEEGATAAQIEEAYARLHEKYAEERFLDGEKGNEAARMLGKIEVAKDELLAELAEADKENGTENGDAFKKAEELIKAGDLAEAQRVLDKFNERNAEWHYLQSVLFYRKGWANESKKQLEIAMRMDSENQKYKDAYKKLNDKMEYDSARHKESAENVYDGQTMNSGYADDQMAGSFCADCISCCAFNACLNLMCNGCCR